MRLSCEFIKHGMHGMVLSFLDSGTNGCFKKMNSLLTVTSSCCYCVELNAHSIISLIQSACGKDHQFLPWLHGSQSCEKLFRMMHSMSPVLPRITAGIA